MSFNLRTGSESILLFLYFVLIAIRDDKPFSYRYLAANTKEIAWSCPQALGILRVYDQKSNNEILWKRTSTFRRKTIQKTRLLNGAGMITYPNKFDNERVPQPEVDSG